MDSEDYPVGFQNILLEGTTVVLTWKGDLTLLEAENVTGPWTPVENADSPFIVDTTATIIPPPVEVWNPKISVATKFYQLKKP